MTNEMFIAMRDASTKRRFAMADEKSKEYTRGNQDYDRLCNFKRIGALIEIPTEKVMAVYMLKHVDAFIEYVKTRRHGSEGIISRLDDMRNYADLFEQWVEEERCGKTKRVRRRGRRRVAHHQVARNKKKVLPVRVRGKRRLPGARGRRKKVS